MAGYDGWKETFKAHILAQLQVSSFIRLGDIEGQSENRHWDRIEIMPKTTLIPPHVVRVYALLYKGYH